MASTQRTGPLAASGQAGAAGAVRSVRPLGARERFAVWRWRHRDKLLAIVILGPMLLYFAYFTWVPIVVLAILSFHEWNVIQWPPTFVGLDNYTNFFTDPFYHQVLRNTIVFGLIVLVVNVSLSFCIALLLNEQIRGRAIFRTIWYLPVVISGAVMAQTLAVFLYPGKIGVFNTVIGAFGYEPIIWTRDHFWMPFWVIAFTIWRGIGYNVVFFLAGLQAVDPALHEAARVDGANRWQGFWSITVPQIAPITLFVVVTGLVGSLQIWEAPLILTLGGPDNTTNTMVYSIYKDAFSSLSVGMAAAQSLLLLIVLTVLSGLNLRLFRAGR
jgi:multiple sugar transport system permease protein